MACRGTLDEKTVIPLSMSGRVSWCDARLWKRASALQTLFDCSVLSDALDCAPPLALAAATAPRAPAGRPPAPAVAGGGDGLCGGDGALSTE